MVLGDTDTGAVVIRTNPVQVDSGNQSALGTAGNKTAMTRTLQVGLCGRRNASGARGEIWTARHLADKARVYG